MSDTQAASVRAFIKKWKASAAAERANYALFLTELCDVLGVAHPEATVQDERKNAYVFEKTVEFRHPDGAKTTGRIDLYKRGCFVLEAKQGSEAEQAKELALDPRPVKKRKGTAVRGTAGWDDAMLRARAQAENYLRNLPTDEPTPPFLVVVDVGHSIELYSEFSRSGRTYLPFPTPRDFRLKLDDLEKEEVRERLRLVWTDPLQLDPTRRSAKVTREVAAKLAELAKSLEKSHKPKAVADYLMRALFTMFAEDIGLLPSDAFTQLLEGYKGKADKLHLALHDLWKTMNDGGFSPVLRETLLRFNGGLFRYPDALPINEEQLALLVHAAKSDWSEVEPAIFGTLLERALDPLERHALGAHYTPRTYVERLVLPTVVDPLRAEWDAVKAAAVSFAKQGELKDARKQLTGFHARLCKVRVLDPACGSGNFLYVTMEHLKILEGEVIDLLDSMGGGGTFEMEHHTVDPHQFLGLEVNERAAAIAEMVLWIGYLQWHFRSPLKNNPPDPVLRDFKNIEWRDAVLAYDREQPRLDEGGKPVTRWDGRTYKKHPVTGEDVPDESARVPVNDYVNPRKAVWPQADYVVGNPPFIGNKRMRLSLGDGYVEALREAHSEVPEAADYVMYWWDLAARLLRAEKIKRFGFITTNSITQTFNRKVVANHLSAKEPISLIFAVPDHPWVDSADGAAVRIAMTTSRLGNYPGELLCVTSEAPINEQDGEQLIITEPQKGKVNADLSVGADATSVSKLRANENVGFMGVTLVGEGFRIAEETLEKWGYDHNHLPQFLRRYRNGKELMHFSQDRFVIDFFNMSEAEARAVAPKPFQWILERVRPERLQNKRETYRKNWWIFAEPRTDYRKSMKGLSRYIATCRTAKHRVFMFLDSDILPDAKIIAICLEDAHYLGVLSSRPHLAWALRTGAFLGVGNDSNYNHSACFGTFPFPDCTDDQKEKIRQLAEQLDAHRKARQAEHPDLTMTDMYNVLEKLRVGETLSAKDKAVHDKGLVSVLRQLHNDLDRAVFEAYGWPPGLSDEEILERLVALNKERAAEEARGTVRWLRPEFQNPTGRAGGKQVALLEDAKPKAAKVKAERARKTPWPKTPAERARLVRELLGAEPVTPEQLAKKFSGGPKDKADRVAELLDALVTLGQAVRQRGGKYRSATA